MASAAAPFETLDGGKDHDHGNEGERHEMRGIEPPVHDGAENTEHEAQRDERKPQGRAALLLVLRDGCHAANMGSRAGMRQTRIAAEMPQI